jgi:dolichol-phosphate mannosyltransferase
MKLVSIIVPAFNEEMNVERAYKAVKEVFDDLPNYDFEMMVMDNHSTDRTFEILHGLASVDPRVRVIRFSKNVGYQRSVLTGYQSVTGDCSIQIDCDLQDPPSLIPIMLEKWEEGHDVVYGVRRSLKDGPVIAFLRRLFYKLINRLSEDELPENAGEFRLVNRRILLELKKVRDTSPYVRGLISAMGFSQVGFEYDRGERVAGESKFPIRAMIALAVDGIVNHSLVPLRLASICSLWLGAFTFLLLMFYTITKLVFGQNWPAGFATTTVLLLMSITVNAMFLGIIGEYLGRIFMQIKQLNVPIVERSLNFPAELDVTDGNLMDTTKVTATR